MEAASKLEWDMLPETLAGKTVLADAVSTGVFEGSRSWASAKLGVFAGAKVMRLAALLPIPGARLAAIPLSSPLFALKFLA